MTAHLMYSVQCDKWYLYSVINIAGNNDIWDETISPAQWCIHNHIGSTSKQNLYNLDRWIPFAPLPLTLAIFMQSWPLKLICSPSFPPQKKKTTLPNTFKYKYSGEDTVHNVVHLSFFFLFCLSHLFILTLFLYICRTSIVDVFAKYISAMNKFFISLLSNRLFAVATKHKYLYTMEWAGLGPVSFPNWSMAMIWNTTNIILETQ